MASFNWPPSGGGGVPIYADLASFPASATVGDLGVAADTGNIYEWRGAAWVIVGGPGAALTLGNLDAQAATAKGAALVSGVLSMQSADATHAGLVNITTQSFAGNKTFTGTISASNLSGTNTGDVTLGTANGLSLAGQALSLALSSTSTVGALSAADWNTFNNKQSTLTLGNLTDAGTDGITVTGGSGAVVGSGTSISQRVADATHNGYLSSTDWTTFNSKQAALTIGNLTDAGTDGITVTGGTGSVIGSGTSIAQHVADTTHNGYLSSTDWNTFNGKQATVTIGALDAQAANANGLALVANVLSAQSADATHPGLVNTTTQTLAGVKTFSSAPNLSSLSASLPLKLDASKNILAQAIALGGSEVSGTLTVGNGGTGVATLAAHGVLIGNTTSGINVTSAGTAGQALISNGASADPTFQAVSAGAFTVTSQTSTYAILTTDNVVLCSGAAFTVTLPTAVGLSGHIYVIKKTDSSLANVITIATTSSQTIDGLTTRKLCTLNDTVTLISDGSNWQVQDHKSDTAWVTTYAFVPNATAFGTISAGSYYTRRVGDTCEFKIYFTTGNCTANTAKIAMPTGMVIDSTKMAATNTLLDGLMINAFTADNIFNSVSLQTGLPFYDGSDTAAIYLTVKTAAASAVAKANATVWMSNSTYTVVTGKVAITDWW